METILSLQNVTKKYKNFTLDHVSFDIPRGMIFGLIGENGAGKTTTIQSILDLIKTDSGTIEIFGKDHCKDAKEIKQKLGVIMDGLNQNPYLKCGDLDKILGKIYRSWDSQRFFSYLDQFKLPREKKIKELSKGMNVKLNFAAALSYHPQLLLLDEATSGLDPVMRADILEILQEFVTDEQNSILMSTHITSDLDKIADYVLFLHEGKLMFLKSREALESYGVLHCTEEFFRALAPEDYDAYLKEEFSYKVLVPDRYTMRTHFEGLLLDRATIEDIMLFYVKGVRS